MHKPHARFFRNFVGVYVVAVDAHALPLVQSVHDVVYRDDHNALVHKVNFQIAVEVRIKPVGIAHLGAECVGRVALRFKCKFCQVVV